MVQCDGCNGCNVQSEMCKVQSAGEEGCSRVPGPHCGEFFTSLWSFNRTKWIDFYFYTHANWVRWVLDSGSLRLQPSSASPSSCSAKPGRSRQGQSAYILLLDFSFPLVCPSFTICNMHHGFVDVDKVWPNLEITVQSCYMRSWEGARTHIHVWPSGAGRLATCLWHQGEVTFVVVVVANWNGILSNDWKPIQSF